WPGAAAVENRRPTIATGTSGPATTTRLSPTRTPPISSSSAAVPVVGTSASPPSARCDATCDDARSCSSTQARERLRLVCDGREQVALLLDANPDRIQLESQGVGVLGGDRRLDLAPAERCGDGRSLAPPQRVGTDRGLRQMVLIPIDQH